jgi:hypothetical protein
MDLGGVGHVLVLEAVDDVGCHDVGHEHGLRVVALGRGADRDVQVGDHAHEALAVAGR